jgi:site-specific DNA-cytosine methylase
VRKYSDKEITPELLAKLADLLNYTPTGCNDHRIGLVFVTGERLQTLPDGYTNVDGVSTQMKYESIGNGWTVDVISHIFSFINL